MNRQNWMTTPRELNYEYVKEDTKIRVKFKKLYSDAVTPSYESPENAGLVLTATHMTWDGSFIECGTSIAIEIPSGYLGLILPCTSTPYKDAIDSKNCLGLISSGYCSEIKVRLSSSADEDFLYKAGQKIAQLVIIPYPEIELEEVEEFSFAKE